MGRQCFRRLLSNVCVVVAVAVAAAARWYDSLSAAPLGLLLRIQIGNSCRCRVSATSTSTHYRCLHVVLGSNISFQAATTATLQRMVAPVVNLQYPLHHFMGCNTLYIIMDIVYTYIPSSFTTVYRPGVCCVAFPPSRL